MTTRSPDHTPPPQPPVLSRARARLFRARKAASAWRRGPVLLALLAINSVFLFLLSRPSSVLPRALSLSPSAPVPRVFAPPEHLLTPLQRDVRNVTATTYRAYLVNCLGKDEFVPATGGCEDWFNIGLTLLDSLDTLLLMGLDEEYQMSRQWAERYLSFDSVTKEVSVFEIVIRATGGMNSAYQLTGDTIWLEKSVELADYLLLSFKHTRTGCPPTSVYIGEKRAKMQSDLVDYSPRSNPAEAGTLQLEFRTLTEMTGDRKYADAVDRCMHSLITALSDKEPLCTDGFDLENGVFTGSRVSISAMVDSFYEMQLKTWVGYGKKDDELRVAFERAVKATFETLVRKEHYHTYAGEYYKGNPNSFRHTMEHLACFFPGTLAYAALHGLGGGIHGKGSNEYIPMARELTKSCYAMSRGMFHGLAGEVTDFSKAVPKPKRGQDHNLIRPEIVEALYYMDKIDPEAGNKYKEWGEHMWKGLREYAQVPHMESGILSSTYNLLGVGQGHLYHSGKLHSFAIAETYKYFFMLFDSRPPSEGAFPLTDWVYNTEAHPVRIVNGQ